MTKFKLFLKIAAILVGVLVAGLLITNAVFVQRSGGRLEARLAELRAAGQPITLMDLKRPPLPPEKNGATYFRRAQSDVKAFCKEIASLERQNGFDRDQLKPAEIEAYRRAFVAYPKIVPLLQQAAEATDYDAELDYTLDPNAALVEAIIEQTGQYRQAIHVLEAHVSLNNADKRYDEALKTCLMMLRLARHFERGPTLINQLVVYAVRSVAMHSANRVLRAGGVAAAGRMLLDEELANADTMAGYEHSLRTERAHSLDIFRGPIFNSWLTRVFWNRDKISMLDLYEREIKLASWPWSEIKAADEEYKRESSSADRPTLTLLMMPAIQKSRTAASRTRAVARCLRVFNALQSFVEKNPGVEPNVTKLGLSASATTDPFDGKPLRLKKTDAGWIVYTVGWDLKDDGGLFDKLKDFGVGPITKK